ncbi:MAG: peptide ABC transporter substrate-binding protein [Ruminococcaceae bacterium]|nr:peptide ABC transporter substrate-binding protein [Oscillospiraceae bacterium]
MKRIISLLLCAVMLLGVLSACTTIEGDNSGMVIDVYMTTPLTDFDPAMHYDDSAMIKIFDMVYEGLTDLDAEGKWKKALMKSYEFKGSDEDGYSLLITLNSTRWTDGRTVQAADFVYAWKRILDPDFKSEAAALLFDIRNARDVKLGDASVDDVGVSSVDTYVLQIDFDYKIDVDLFLANLASPALVPLREDIVSRDVNWAKQSSTLVTNGPFAIKEFTAGSAMRLERSNYYYLEADNETQAIDKFVIPYRLENNLAAGDAAAQLAKFEAGELFYLGEIPLASRAQYKDTAVITDELSTHSYYFNTTNKLFSDARVRKALSMAIDRNEIVKILTYAKAATGIIPEKVFDTAQGTSFRAVGGELIKSSADVAGAQSLLKEAGVTSGSFTITIRATETDRAVAEYVAGVWNSLGFKVTVKETEVKKLAGYDNAYADAYDEIYKSGKFDVIAVDFQMLAPDAFSALAPFATSFSGNGVDMNSKDYDLHGHITGYSSEAYNALIDSAYAEKTAAGRAAILHDAEKMLVEDMPIIPLAFLQDAYLINAELSGNKDSYFGTREFKRMKLKDYVQYLPADMQGTTAAEESAAQ